MAIGDRIPKELIAPSALSNAATTKFTNQSASYRTQLTQIFLCNTSSSQRVVTLYKNGTGTTNQIANSITLPANTSTIIDTKLIFTGTQTLAAKQDTGADVNIAAYGIEEQIA